MLLLPGLKGFIPPPRSKVYSQAIFPGRPKVRWSKQPILVTGQRHMYLQCLWFPSFVWLLLFSLSRTGPPGPWSRPPILGAGQSQVLASERGHNTPSCTHNTQRTHTGHNTPSRDPRPCTLGHHGICLPLESAFLGRYVNMQCGRSPPPPWAFCAQSNARLWAPKN